jgi:polyprenyl P-hydroxybenzoate and phenylacrylic acid decarboxylases
VPCSMNTLGAIANGLGDTLLMRAASVAMKENRKLIAVVRETPLSLIHIENMAKLARAGGCVMPASPGFYSNPTEIWQLVGGMVCRILDNLGIDNDFAERWNGVNAIG